MITKQAPETQSAPEAEIFSFAEGCCYKDEQPRATTIGIVYRLFSVGKGLGFKLDTEVHSTNWIYFGVSNEHIVEELEREVPHVPWGNYIYHRWLDQSKVQVLRPHDGRVVAQLEVRRYYGRKVRAAAVEAGAHGPNVVVLARSSVPGEPVAVVQPTGGA